MGAKVETPMKTVILCGGRGTRLDRHGKTVPKALFRIGDEPLILHLFRIYRSFGLAEFALCLGHLSEKFGEYFELPIQTTADSGGTLDVWGDQKVGLFDTGAETNTGGRIFRLRDVLKDEDIFCATYGDGLANVDLARLIDFHRSHGRVATLTAVNPVSSFGLIDLENDGTVIRFREKPRLNEWVNGGFFVFGRQIFEYLGEDSVLEKEPFEALARDGELRAFRHSGFWKCMDTFKDNIELNELWEQGAPWKTW